MIVVGAKGFAQEVFEVLYQNKYKENIAFYDDVSDDIEDFLFEKFPILKTTSQVNDFFNKTSNKFTLGIGNSFLRYKLYKKFISLKGTFTSVISTNSNIGAHNVTIGEGCNILPGVHISNSVTIGKGSMIYYNSVITHDCVIGDFVEISPSVNVLGRVKIGSYTHLGANATILPNINVGENVIVGSGAVVTKDVPDNTTVLGVPARIVNKPNK